MKSQNKKSFNSSQSYDIVNSTFKQIIYLSNGKQFVGYSKKLGYNEKHDKAALLQNWIIRMYNSGYLKKQLEDTQKGIDEINYFLNTSLPIPILKLSYNSYQILDLEWCTNNIKIVRFLDSFYELLNNKKEDEISRLFDFTKSNDDVLCLKKKRFLTDAALLNYCKDMIQKEKSKTAEIKAFYYKYKEKFLN